MRATESANECDKNDARASQHRATVRAVEGAGEREGNERKSELQTDTLTRTLTRTQREPGRISQK